MAMVVKNNMSAVSTLNTLNKNSSALQKSLQKVSSGMKINSAQDDASGYAISEKMRVQIRSLDQANQNTQNASSMMKTAEGAVSSTVEILKSLKEKAINAATDTNTDSDRVTIQKEIDQFIDQIDDNALTTFNGKYMVDGSKQQEGDATFTAMTNQSLSKSTNGSTALTALKNRNDDSLEIASTDYVTASFVMNGKTYTTKFGVSDTTKFNATTGATLEDVFSQLNSEYQAQNAGNSESTVAVFGAANIPAAGTTSSLDSTTAISTLSSASVAQLADAVKNGTNATVSGASEVATAAAYLQSEGVTLADTGLATTDTAILTLSASIAAAAATISTDVTATGGKLAADTTTVTAKFNGTEVGSTTHDAAISEDASATVVVDASSASEALTTAATAAIAGDVDAGSDATTTTSVADATTVAFSVSTTSTNTATIDPTSTSVADASTSGVEDYAKAYAYEKLLSGGSSGDLVHDGSDIGLNTAGDMVYTANGEEGLTVTAAKSSVQRQISGVTISITDSEGQVKKSANASLDDFNTTIYAKNKSDRNELTFQVGAAANQSITVGLDDMRSEALGLKSSDGTKVSVATQDNANAAIKVFDNAIQKALDQQTTIGAVEARLEYTSNNLTTSSENVQAAESTIRDADMAKEMTAYTKNNVLLQAAQSMLAQANQSSSQVLSLLQ